MSGLALIPTAQLSSLQDDNEVQARRNNSAILKASPWLHDLEMEVTVLAHQPGTVKAKYNRLRKLADRISGAVTPFAACRKGCSECCKIATPITSYEADLLGEAIKRKPRKVGVTGNDLASRERFFGVPCPFLKKGACSIYENRPLACRLHFNIADTALFCDTSIAPDDSRVANLDLTRLWVLYSMIFMDAPRADIRDYFPQ